MKQETITADPSLAPGNEDNQIQDTRAVMRRTAAGNETAVPETKNSTGLPAGEIERYLQEQLSRGSFTVPAMIQFLEPLFERHGFRRPAAEPERILVIRPDEIGDFVMTSSFLRELRRRYPESRITLAVKPQVYPLAELCPYVNRIIPFDWQALLRHRGTPGMFTGLVRFCREHLWQQPIDLCLLPRYDHDTYFATLLAYFSGAARRVGYTEYATPSKQRINRGFDALLTDVLPGRGAKHEVRRNLDMIAYLGGKIGSSKLDLWLAEEDRAFARRGLSNENALYIAISPGNTQRRAWPPEYYIELAKLVGRHIPQSRFIILGAPGEEEPARRMQQALPERFLDFTGKLTLRQTGALLARCGLYLGRNTGVMHMAAAAGIPVVEISCHAKNGDPNGAVSPERFSPWAEHSVTLRPEQPTPPCSGGCRQKVAHCILQITPPQAAQAVMTVLDRQKEGNGVSAAASSLHSGGHGMKILLIHPNFPAQFLHLAPVLARDPQNTVVFLTNRQEGRMEGVHKVLFNKSREVAPQTHNYVRPLEDAVLQGQAGYRSMLQLKQRGFAPDVIYAHSGWGPGFFMKDLFPQAKVLNYFEWFYHAHGSDADFDPAEPLTIDGECRIRLKNAPILVDLYSCDRGISPTYFQRSQFPPELQPKLTVLHDGVDTSFYQPKPDAKLVLPQKSLDLSAVEEIITYVGRGMEPYRGFPQFMEAVDIVLRRRPKCHVVIVGADRVAYGRGLPDNKSYKQAMLEKLDMDLTRVHFTGLLPYGQYRQVLQASSVHVYLTRPFVLSWSFMEAMASGCLLVASDTAPVREVITHGENGLLADFFDPVQIAARIEESLDNPDKMRSIRANARQTMVERYALSSLLPRQVELLRQMVEKS